MVTQNMLRTHDHLPSNKITMIKTVHGAMRMYIQQEQFCRQNEAYFKPWYLY